LKKDQKVAVANMFASKQDMQTTMALGMENTFQDEDGNFLKRARRTGEVVIYMGIEASCGCRSHL
jgi:hypothetical protein